MVVGRYAICGVCNNSNYLWSSIDVVDLKQQSLLSISQWVDSSTNVNKQHKFGQSVCFCKS